MDAQKIAMCTLTRTSMVRVLHCASSALNKTTGKVTGSGTAKRLTVADPPRVASMRSSTSDAVTLGLLLTIYKCYVQFNEIVLFTLHAARRRARAAV